MNNYTHQKRPYRAECIQWDGTNTNEIISMFHDARLHGTEHLVVRYGHGVATLIKGSWVVRGENSAIKFYSDEVFNVKYQHIAG